MKWIPTLENVKNDGDNILNDGKKYGLVINIPL
jgi:hypothetical protein